jgi:hypothetical protein
MERNSITEACKKGEGWGWRNEGTCRKKSEFVVRNNTDIITITYNFVGDAAFNARYLLSDTVIVSHYHTKLLFVLMSLHVSFIGAIICDIVELLCLAFLRLELCHVSCGRIYRSDNHTPPEVHNCWYETETLFN